MKSLKIASIFFVSLFVFTIVSCDNEPLEGEFATGEAENEITCVEATQNLSTASAVYGTTPTDDANYATVCNAYAVALQNVISTCGDSTGAIQTLLDAINCPAVSENCTDAQTITATAETAYNADTNDENLCNAYKTALENEITACGDAEGSLQVIVDGLDCIVSSDYEIGDVGPGGGFVFYLNGSGGGMEIAPLTTQFQSQWGCYSTSVDGTLSGLGTGQGNSNLILDYHNSINFYADPGQCIAPEPGSGIMVESTGDVAAKNCDDLVFGGMDDWYLPSLDELHLAYTNLHAEGLGDFTTTFLASSTQEPGEHWKFLIVNFGDGGDIWGDWKSDLVNHRAIRSF